jgi:hypothetical protein
VSTTLQCENKLRNSGAPDYVIPAEPNTEPPINQAVSFVEGTHLLRHYPDLEVVLADSQTTSHLVVLVSHDKTVGTLLYETSNQLGWHLTGVEQCSPSRIRQR